MIHKILMEEVSRMDKTELTHWVGYIGFYVKQLKRVAYGENGESQGQDIKPWNSNKLEIQEFRVQKSQSTRS